MTLWNRALRTGAICLLVFAFCAPMVAQDQRQAMSSAATGVQHAGNLAPDARAVSKNADASRRQRMLWIIPNAKAQPISAQAHPLSTGEKWQLVKKDALDPTSLLTAATVGGLAMALDLHQEFGSGVGGAAKYCGAALAGQQVSKVMTGGVFPTLFHQDPRFFIRGSGSAPTRILYALSRVVVTRGDNGRSQFNASEFAGVATAASVGNIYYTSSRGAGPTAVRFGQGIGINAGFNVLKEFWPSIQNKLTRKK